MEPPGTPLSRGDHKIGGLTLKYGLLAGERRCRALTLKYGMPEREMHLWLTFRYGDQFTNQKITAALIIPIGESQGGETRSIIKNAK